MKPLPPIRAIACDRAEASGSSGGVGNGMRSMRTSWHDEPGTSTPCQSVRVPNRQVRGSRANWRTSVEIWSSPWPRTGISSPSRPRMISAAVCAARIDEKRPRVRPPAARTSCSISSRLSSLAPSRPGGGRWAADVGDGLPRVVEGAAHVQLHARRSLAAQSDRARNGVEGPAQLERRRREHNGALGGRPCRAPSIATLIGATAAPAPPRVLTPSQTTSSSRSSRIRSAFSWTSSTAASATCCAPSAS